jgi:hypothetical protein
LSGCLTLLNDASKVLHNFEISSIEAVGELSEDRTGYGRSTTDVTQQESKVRPISKEVDPEIDNLVHLI